MTNQSVIKLAEISEIFSGFAFKSEDLKKGDVPVIRIANIQNKIVLKKCDAFFSNEKITSKLRRYFLQKDDILIAMTGAGSVGKVGKMIQQDNEYLVNQRVGIVRVDPTKANPEYVYQALSQNFYEERLYQLGLGAGQPNVSPKDIGNLEIPLPSIDIQKKLGYILSRYGFLSENNSCRIQVLESVAKLLYDEWFVKFKFPGHENVSFIDSQTDFGEIPDSWEVTTVKELLKRLPAGEKFTQDNVETEGRIPVIDQSENEFLGFHNGEPDHKASPERPIMIFGDHTCKMQIMVKPFSVGPNTIPFISTKYPEAYIYFLIRNLVHTQEYKRHWNELIVKKVVVPKKEIVDEFAAIVTPMLQQITVLKEKNLNFAKTRDLLLPKLISGELDVSELDIKVEVEA